MILRTRPFNPVFDRQPLDRLFDQRTPVVDAAWKDGALVLTADFPGTPAEAVDVTVAGRVLTISVASLSWTRSLKLGTALDAEQVAARYADGRLTVTVSAVAAAEPRRVEVQISTEAQPEIATSDNG